ncbi:MAG TPA: hypothetical protein VIB08_09175 [Thermoanaerobaculia bacterium]
MILRILRHAFCGVLLLSASRIVSGQSPPAPSAGERTLRELLEEVRLLRQVLQATSLGSVRAQILLAQRQGQQDRLAQIERQLADSRSEATDSQWQLARLEEEIATHEDALSTEADPSRRTERESQVRQLRAARDEVKRRQERQRERDTELTALLAAEQGKLDETQRGLDRIERQLETLQKAASTESSPR